MPLQIRNVPHVRVSGFRFREQGAPPGFGAFVRVTNHAPGTVLESLDIEGGRTVNGVNLAPVDMAPHEDPVVVKNCTINVGFDAILVLGSAEAGAQNRPVSGILIRDNRLSGKARGVLVIGAVARVQVTGNRVWGCELSALQVQNLSAGSGPLLIVNNTAYNSNAGFRLWNNPPQEPPVPAQVEVRNNLLSQFAAGDALYVQEHSATRRESGDGAALLRRWRWGHNARDPRGLEDSGRIPLGESDIELDQVDLLSVEPTHPDFLRPPASSPLARGGAGKVDGLLPAYIGALPPAGTEPWDWDRTWRARMRKTEDKK
jgi:hypothetical protein